MGQTKSQRREVWRAQRRLIGEVSPACYARLARLRGAHACNRDTGTPNIDSR
jgi:hypothetical protein